MEANNDTAIHFELLAEERQREAEQNRLDAQRYRKLKANFMLGLPVFDPNAMRSDFDASVDALPEVKK